MDVGERSVDDGDRRSMKPSSTECSELLDLNLLRKELLDWIKESREHQQQQHECHLASELQRCQNATNDYMPSGDTNGWFVPASEVEPVGRKLGSGAEGTVRKVLWNGGMFAMKEFKNKTARNNEASIAFLVSHPHVVHYFGVSDPEYVSDGYRLFMELLDTDLYICIDRSTKTKKPLFPTEKQMLEVLLQIAQAMEHLHKENVVHGDLKPGNILLSWFELINPNEKYCLVKVADLGSAQRVDSFRCPGGTTLYAAPEVLRWRKDKQLIIEQPLKIDVYSFGIVVYQVLTRLLSMKDMYGAISDSEFRRRVREESLRPDLEELRRYPTSLQALVKECLFEEPAERPTFSKICRTLQDLMDAPFEAQKEQSTSKCLRYADQHSMIHLHTPGVCLLLSDSLILKGVIYVWFVSVIDISSFLGEGHCKVRLASHLRKYTLNILKTLVKDESERW